MLLFFVYSVIRILPVFHDTVEFLTLVKVNVFVTLTEEKSSPVDSCSVISPNEST